MSQTKPTVLLVDPYPLIVASLSRLLRKEWRCTGATNSYRAKNLLEPVTKVVLVEYRLHHEQTGLDFLKSLEASTTNILMVSNFLDRERADVIEAQQSGLVWKVLEKPLGMRHLQNLLRRARRHHHLETIG